jgi:thiol-disulfide isomerase/thioredoxin
MGASRLPRLWSPWTSLIIDEEISLMYRLNYLPALLMAAFLAATPLVTPFAPAFAASKGKDAKTPKSAPCAVCSVREGAGDEPVRATATHEGKTYYFCQDGCRDEFLKNPREFLQADTPRPAPAFSLKDLNGRTVELADLKGKVVLLDFWATWCAPCVASMPRLQKLHQKYAAKGFAVVGVAIDEKGAAVVAPMVSKKKVTYPVLLGTEAAWTAYQVKSLPALFVIDREGRIVKRFGGATDHRTVEKAVQELVAK